MWSAFEAEKCTDSLLYIHTGQWLDYIQEDEVTQIYLIMLVKCNILYCLQTIVIQEMHSMLIIKH